MNKIKNLILVLLWMVVSLETAIIFVVGFFGWAYKESTRTRRPIRYSDYYSNRGRRFNYSNKEAANGKA